MRFNKEYFRTKAFRRDLMITVGLIVLLIIVN